MSDNNIPKSQPARKAHKKLLKSLEKLKKYEQSVLLIFAEIMHKKLYMDLGYSSMFNYAMDALEFSQSKAYYFISVARDLEKLPETKRAIESGSIGWSQAST